jgi:hypothetical protein
VGSVHRRARPGSTPYLIIRHALASRYLPTIHGLAAREPRRAPQLAQRPRAGARLSKGRFMVTAVDLDMSSLAFLRSLPRRCSLALFHSIP